MNYSAATSSTFRNPQGQGSKRVAFLQFSVEASFQWSLARPTWAWIKLLLVFDDRIWCIIFTYIHVYNYISTYSFIDINVCVLFTHLNLSRHMSVNSLTPSGKPGGDDGTGSDLYDSRRLQPQLGNHQYLKMRENEAVSVLVSRRLHAFCCSIFMGDPCGTSCGVLFGDFLRLFRCVFFRMAKQMVSMMPCQCQIKK